MFNFTWILWYCTLWMQFKRVIPAYEALFDNDLMVVESGGSVRSSDITSLRIGTAGYISKIYVYVADTFYADEDLNLNGITELEIFAKTWNITQPVTFDLCGLNGEKQATAAVNGSAGNAGNAGMDGGNFFGLASEIINGDYLTIISHGGNGGDGQDGGTNDDIYVLLNVDDVVGNSGWFSSGDLYKYYNKYFDDRGYDSDVSGIDESTSFYAVFVHDKKATFNVRLHPTTCCGTTGIGGAGGHGGQGGKSTFKFIGQLNTNNGSESTLNILANNGTDGNSGKDGRTCESLALDVRIDTELNKVVFIFLPLHHTFSSNFTLLNHSNSYKCPAVYVRSNDSAGSEPKEIDTPSSVIRYKRFLLENMSNSSLTTIVQQMYKEIDENKEISDQFSVGDFVLEALELERSYFRLKKSTNMVLPYQRLFDKVERMNRLKGADKTELSHLQSMLQAKLEDIADQKNYSLVFKTEMLAELLVSRIDLRNEKIAAISNVDDVELQIMLNQLRFAVNGNYILAEYNHIIEGFRLTYFPFAADYLEGYFMPTSVSAYDDLNEITSTAKYNLKILPSSIENIELENPGILMNQMNNRSNFALLIWKNSDIRDKILAFFGGKKITLLADVKVPKPGYTFHYNAMKFNAVDFVFRASDPAVNVQLNDVLKSFQLKLNHTGISTMRCNNNFYEIINNPIVMEFSFQKNEDGVPVPRTLIYDMLRENPATLNPFALWELQIVDDNRRNLAKLARFKQLDIDIELHATGKYIEEDALICGSENLPKFYTQV